jgi:DNA-directed RNA polymerase sigma subunit (sigma70/sigma32)
MPYRKVKPMPNEQVKRNELILQYRYAHPEATLEEIGQIFRISKARVFQILERAQKTTESKR